MKYKIVGIRKINYMEVLKQEIRIMLTGSKIVTLIMLSLFFLELFGGGIRRMAMGNGWTAGPWLLPCLLHAPVFSNCIMLLVVFLFSGMPFKGGNQMLVLQRAGRMQWFIGQILAMTVVSAAYSLFLLFGSVLVMLPCISLKNEWGNAYIACVFNEQMQLEKYKVAGGMISDIMIKKYTPVSALLISLVLIFFLCLLYGSILFLINGVTNSYTGVIVLSVWSFASMFLDDMGNIFSFSQLKQISPVYWANIENISLENGMQGSFTTVVIVMFLVVLLLMVAAGYFIKKKRISLDA